MLEKCSLFTSGVKVFKILWHLLNLSIVVILNFSDELSVVWQDEIDSNTLSTKSTGSTNSVDINFLLLWELVVDNKTDLLNINTSCEKIGGDQNSGCTSSEFLHNCISLHLIHFRVHSRYDKVFIVHCLF